MPSFLFRLSPRLLEDAHKQPDVAVLFSEALVAYLLENLSANPTARKSDLKKFRLCARVINPVREEFVLRSLTVRIREQNVGLQDAYLLTKQIQGKIFNDDQEYRGRLTRHLLRLPRPHAALLRLFRPAAHGRPLRVRVVLQPVFHRNLA